LISYFPREMRDTYRHEIAGHRLRREIVATSITNSIINVGGPAVMVRLAAETGRDSGMLAQGFLATGSVLGGGEAWAGLDRLCGKLPGQLQLDLYQRLQTLIVTETARLLRRQRGRPLADLASSYQSAAQQLSSSLAKALPPARRAALEAETRRLADAGL